MTFLLSLAPTQICVPKMDFLLYLLSNTCSAVSNNSLKLLLCFTIRLGIIIVSSPSKVLLREEVSGTSYQKQTMAPPKPSSKLLTSYTACPILLTVSWWSQVPLQEEFLVSPNTRRLCCLPNLPQNSLHIPPPSVTSLNLLSTSVHLSIEFQSLLSKAKSNASKIFAHTTSLFHRWPWTLCCPSSLVRILCLKRTFWFLPSNIYSAATKVFHQVAFKFHHQVWLPTLSAISVLSAERRTSWSLWSNPNSIASKVPAVLFPWITSGTWPAVTCPSQVHLLREELLLPPIKCRQNWYQNLPQISSTFHPCTRPPHCPSPHIRFICW